MKTSTPRSSKTARRQAQTAAKAQETLGAAAAVIAARTEMAMLACAAPSAEAEAEMALMVTEKLEAFSKAGGAVAVGAAELAGRSAHYATEEMAAAGQGFLDLVTCRSPDEVLKVQTRLMSGWLDRAYGFGMGVNGMAARTGERALAPVHKAVTSNDRRLRKG